MNILPPTGVAFRIFGMMKFKLLQITTIILPKYIKAGNDVSGTAVKVTMSMDYELALQAANDWRE